MSESGSPSAGTAPIGAQPDGGTQIDATQVAFALEHFRSQQNLAAGIVAGLAASLLGAALWAVVTVGSGYQIGWMAVAVGFLVGFAVRTAGKGIDRAFGFVGATLALLGCVLGNLLAVSGMIAQHQHMAFAQVLSRLDAPMIQKLMTASFSGMDLLFYGIAVYEGFKLSFRQLTPGEVTAALDGPASAA